MNPRRVQIRRYEEEIRTLLNNLAQHPDELRRWRDRDLQTVVVEPLYPAQLADYTVTRNRAVGMGFHIYPSFRTQPSTLLSSPPFNLSFYFSRAFWQTNADRLTNLAALRLPGDLWIGLDTESFAGTEPSAAALAGPGATVAQMSDAVARLREAMQPFIDALRDTNASIAVFPVEPWGEDWLYIADVLGRERLELWTESTYPNAEYYRRSSRRDWPNAATAFLRLLGQLQQRFPGCLVRPGISDLERVWADPYRLDLLRGGTAAPWGYDDTRWDDRRFHNLGTPEHRDGTRLSSLNRVRHVWPIQPMRRDVPAEFDTTLTAEPTPLNAVAGTAAGISAIAEQPLHPDGIQLVTPPLPNTWAGLFASRVLPRNVSAPFTIDGTFQLPDGPLASCPLFGMVLNNVAVWQVAYDAAPARNMLSLYVRTGQPGTSHSETLDIMSVPLPGESRIIRIQIGRNRREWLFQAILLTAPNQVHGGRSTLTGDPPEEWESLIIGAGQRVPSPDVPGQPPEFWRPAHNTLAGCPGIVIMGTWSIYDRLLSDDELRELRAGSWPYGYGRPGDWTPSGP